MSDALIYIFIIMGVIGDIEDSQIREYSALAFALGMVFIVFLGMIY